MLEFRDKYESWKKIKIGVLTWNLAGKGPDRNMDISSVVLPAN
jgi:hypothetical protein